MSLRDAAFKLDPLLWANEVLAYYPDSWAQKVMMSPARYVIENVSRQAGKSTCSAAMAVHQAVFFPGSLVLVVSPTLRQSGELQRKCLKFYDKVDPHHKGLAEDTKLSIQLANGSRIIALPGQEENLRGYSAPSLIIEDEASRVSDDLYTAIRPMLATNQGRLILLSTPNGKMGHFHKIWTEGGAEWLKIKVTADQIARISPEFLANERLNMTEAQFLQEYFGEFMEAEGAVFSSDLFKSLANPAVSALKI
ncbi:MAG: Terminase-like family protein [Methanosaeta sp. PtaB.Bin018]|jgi:hypothetical protein|nr:MAG: Terminase-like family protein [Methanosaeta sp. PtaB.Bin018]OPY48155.1 MAG: Terminase-like family protein [Methanosaeta sp. PtaU1.Bin016]